MKIFIAILCVLSVVSAAKLVKRAAKVDCPSLKKCLKEVADRPECKCNDDIKQRVSFFATCMAKFKLPDRCSEARSVCLDINACEADLTDCYDKFFDDGTDKEREAEEACEVEYTQKFGDGLTTTQF